jgi:hypothetical protein
VSQYKEYQEAGRSWLETYGKPESVGTPDPSIEPNRIWTVWFWDNGEWITNEYVPDDGTLDISEYYITPKPWDAEPGSIQVHTSMWTDCNECKAGAKKDSEECEACEGAGTILIDFI